MSRGICFYIRKSGIIFQDMKNKINFGWMKWSGKWGSEQENGTDVAVIWECQYGYTEWLERIE